MKADCSWPTADVLVNLDGSMLVLSEDLHQLPKPYAQHKHGIVKKGSIQLTVKEAMLLRAQLKIACNKARELSIEFDYHGKAEYYNAE